MEYKDGMKCYICGTEEADGYNECAVCGKIYCEDCGTLTDKGETCENCTLFDSYRAI